MGGLCFCGFGVGFSASPFLCWLCRGLMGCFSDTFGAFLCSFVCFSVFFCGFVWECVVVYGISAGCAGVCGTVWCSGVCSGCRGSVRSLRRPVYLLLMFGRGCARVPGCAGLWFAGVAGCLLRESIDIRAQRFGWCEREACSWLSVGCTTGA